MRILALGVLFSLLALSARAQEIGGTTNLTRDPGHGTQIEYLSPEGRAFLWYPGNRDILPGVWEMQGDKLCFAYGENTYNPVTGHQGGSFECAPLDFYFKYLSERAKGDVFGLETRRRVPFDLTGKDVSLQDVVDALQ